jgi:hypothetical protein
MIRNFIQEWYEFTKELRRICKTTVGDEIQERITAFRHLSKDQQDFVLQYLIDKKLHKGYELLSQVQKLDYKGNESSTRSET